ncbi:MAG TPA: 2-C-methyl-D-erythritol 4-phosphate cytidylyltransferase [Cellvibrionaceae bacterium]
MPAAICPSRLWIVVPAAGQGARMGAELPKQYLPLNGKTLLDSTLGRLLQIPELAGVVVALADNDRHWAASIYADDDRITTVTGGAERAESVRCALTHLLSQATAADWVMVHDAARPCIRPQALLDLLGAAEQHQGAILARQVSETVKSVVNGVIDHTVDRQLLWTAQTPQLFRVGDLHQWLSSLLKAGIAVTDEASAAEHHGVKPAVIKGPVDNIKITHPEDLAFAEMILAQQAKEGIV